MTKIQNAVNILKKGGVAIFPTDTVYGIGTLPEKKYVEKIYKIKKRDFSKKIIALISDKKILSELIDETDENMKKIENILEKYWPGELTVIFQANQNFTKNFDKNMETIGIRIPKNKTALEIIKKSGGVLLTTSANISGENAVTKAKSLSKELLKNVDAVVQNENTELTGNPSTIVKYENGKFSLLREGNVSFTEIMENFK
ncbi:L-threonylcarbamoyladenylate synthase [Leptotrichia sp. oral taxon 223]|uniref:L-threonylcarbamoyladenylate synthase n=1 Tax=Leptotrichia sp. oral taxon 223 TaxID=712363 RepID=UPI00210365C5|nr:L-threonylcarbamoyladenylate synthase [Leptotrichia sp. oral taxon 223]